MQIENKIFSNSLPVNSIAIANRLIELLKEKQINSLNDSLAKDKQIEKCLWLLNSQYFGQIAKIDLGEWWDYLYYKENNKEVK